MSKISFRLNPKTYLKIEAIAAQKGLSPGAYIKKRLEDESEDIHNDLRLLKYDLEEIMDIDKEILKIILSNKSKSETQNPTKLDYKNDNMILEILMILREISQPAKVASAQKRMAAIGVEPYSILDK